MQFQLVVCGLDSIEARRWINATLVNMVDPDSGDTYKPLIDGGTEGELTLITHFLTYTYPRQVSRDNQG